MASLRAPAPRFKLPTERPTIQLTPDDDRILWHAYRHRLIDSAMLYALLPERSPQNLSRRLNSLRKAGYLDRPPQQMERVRLSGGSAPLVYALGRHGAVRLRDLHGAAVSPDRWRQKNTEIRGRSIQHTLATTRFLVELEIAARRQQAVELLHADQVLSADRLRRPGALTLRPVVDWYGHHGEEGTAPDRLIALRDRRLPAERDTQVLLIEIDQGTETIAPSGAKLRSRSFFRDTSLLRKFVIYAQAFRSGTHRDQLGIPVFRVLTVTTSPARVAQMQAAYQAHLATAPLQIRPGLFLFTDWTSWSTQTGEGRIVFNGDGKPVSIL